MSARFLHVSAAITALLSADCGPSPIAPSLDPDRYRISRVDISCSPTGRLVECRAVLVDVPHYGDRGDVTETATWSVSAPSIATIAQGIVTPIQRGEVDINARVGTRGALSFPSFRVDPSANAQSLHSLLGSARNARTEVVIPGVMLTIIAGDKAGASTVTNGFGAFSFDRLLTGDTIRVRAEKDGFLPVEASGCVRSIGPTGCAVISLRLTPIP